MVIAHMALLAERDEFCSSIPGVMVHMGGLDDHLISTTSLSNILHVGFLTTVLASVFSSFDTKGPLFEKVRMIPVVFVPDEFYTLAHQTTPL